MVFSGFLNPDKWYECYIKENYSGRFRKNVELFNWKNGLKSSADNFNTPFQTFQGLCFAIFLDVNMARNIAKGKIKTMFIMSVRFEFCQLYEF